MDEAQKPLKPNPYDEASFFSRIYFWWVIPLMKRGWREELVMDDMYEAASSDTSQRLCERLNKQWRKELKKREHGGTPSLTWAIVRAFGAEIGLFGILVFMYPIFLGKMIDFFQKDGSMSVTEVYGYAAGLVGTSVLLALTLHPYFFYLQRTGMRIRIACCSLVYRKTLRLSNSALTATTPGHIVNLMSNDVLKFDTTCVILHYMWLAPLEVIVVLAILWSYVGPSSVAGFVLLLFFAPLQVGIGKLFSKFRMTAAKCTDKRVQIMYEILAGMKILKMYCWEKPFSKLVSEARRKELVPLSRLGYLYLGTNIANVSEKLCLLPLIVWWYCSPPLQLSIYFMIFAWYRICFRRVIFKLIPRNVYNITACKVSIKRLQTFLLRDEVTFNFNQPGLRPKPQQRQVLVDALTAAWEGKDVEDAVIKSISFSVKPGEILAVVGPVGAGKSSLLMALLRELSPLSGSISIKGRVGYASQVPWVFSASIRQNIIHGQTFDMDRYNQAIHSCALEKDIEELPHGDGTLVGERGVTLSGGQKARLSLARTLYSQADVFLLDDPLSAVDAAVGKFLFNETIRGDLKPFPVILVTHQLQFLEKVDKILVLKEGETIAMGTYGELAQSGLDFTELLHREEEEDNVSVSMRQEDLMSSLFTSQEAMWRSGEAVNNSCKSNPHLPMKKLYSSKAHLRLTKSTNDAIDKESEMVSLMSLQDGEEEEPFEAEARQDEIRTKGTVSWQTYYRYFTAGTPLVLVILTGLAWASSQVIYVLTDWWLASWAAKDELVFSQKSSNSSANTSDDTSDDAIEIYITGERHRYFFVYLAFIIILSIVVVTRTLALFKVCMNASKVLHDKMFTSVVRTPMRFFDTNPVGRTLNRFSKDMGQMDDLLPSALCDILTTSMHVISVLIIACSVNPWVILPVVPILCFFVLLGKFYLASSRDIKRVESIARSPVYSHLSNTLSGLFTIRSLQAEQQFVEEFETCQDRHTAPFFISLAVARWLAVVLDWLSVLFLACVVILSLVARNSLGLNPQSVGLALAYSASLTGMFQWMVRQSAAVENQMISVERVMEYSKLPSEAPLEQPKDPQGDWPIEGAVECKGAHLRYDKNLPHALEDLTFTIEPREKVGVVGRTGAGKSSLVTLLFRLAEPEGQVTIDGINIGSLGLHTLRDGISIIPQDPFLFAGTVRKNLDPFDELMDSKLLQALDDVELLETVQDLPGVLDAKVNEGGSNFSVGQRQLICLARAILRQNRLLIIDEATANVDPRTDALIQKTIRTKFQTCTVLTIAHRLHTIMDSNRVLVMDRGHVVEFDTPHSLLCSKTSAFYRLASSAGPAELVKLQNIAKATKENETDSPSTESRK